MDAYPPQPLRRNVSHCILDKDEWTVKVLEGDTGKIKMDTWNIAKFGVSTGWLLANDINRPMTAVDGNPWTHKDRTQLSDFYKRLGPKLGPDKVAVLRAAMSASTCAVLLQEYIRTRAFFEDLCIKDPQAMMRWSERSKQAWSEFVNSDPVLAEHAKNARVERLSRASLQSIRDDLDVVGEFLVAAE